MTGHVWWIPFISWRISSAIIFFFILHLWGKEEKRKGLFKRKMLCFLGLCCSSWCMRFCIEEWLKSQIVAAVGYSIYIMILSLLFVVCYRFCYKTTRDGYIFYSIIALTVYRMAWHAVKVVSSLTVRVPWEGTSLFQAIMSYAGYASICIICFWVYRKLVKKSYLFQTRSMAWLFAAFMLCHMILEFCYQVYMAGSTQDSFLFFFTAFLYCVMNYSLLLMLPYLSRLQRDNANMHNFIKSKQEYYEISRGGILSLQTKCHDLKHQIALIRSAEGQRQFDRYLNRLEDSINEYNTVVDTGNKCLDVVLTEKNIICSTCGIKFTYIIDGTMFDFLSEMEIYALFGNIMDNAIESMAHTTEPERRFISMKAAKKNDMIILFVENYYENELKYENGIPVTNKKETHHHGFGLRSIMSIAQQNGGMASIHAEDHLFKLTVTMMESVHVN